METFEFGLKLVDGVTAVGKRSADAIKGVEASAKKAQKALDFSPELEKSEHQLKRLKFDPAGYKKLIQAQKELAEQRKKLGRQGLTDVFKEKFSFGRMTGAAFLGDLLAESMIEGAHKAVEFITEGIKKAFEAGSKSEQLRLGTKYSLGKGAGAFDEDVERFAKQTGLDDDTIKGMLLPLRRAGFDQKGARTSFAIASDLAVMNGKGGDQGFIGGILDTLTDIRLKGGVGEKRLVSMGINSQDFYKSLAKKTHTSVATAKTNAETGGKIDPQLLINTIGQQVSKQEGGPLATATEDYAKSFKARLERLADLPEEYLKVISKSPAWTRLTDKMGMALEALDPNGPRGQKIVASLIGLFDKLSDAISNALTPENIDRFASGAQSVLEFIGKIPEHLNQIVTASEILATIWAGSKIVGMFGAIGAAGAPLLAAGAALASVAVAFERIEATAKELGGWDKVMDDLKFFATGKSAVANDTVNQFSPQWKKDKAAGKTVQVNAPMVVHVNGGDPGAAKQVVSDVHRNMINVHERAAQEAG